MGELGIFSAENPVTYQNPLAAYVAAHVKPTEGTCDFPGADMVSSDTRETVAARRVSTYELDHLAYGLPDSEKGKGLIPAQEWAKRHSDPNTRKAEAVLFCNATFWPANPWVDEKRGAVLFRTQDGLYFYGQHPCLVGYDTNPWTRWNIDGTPICDFYQTNVLPDKTLQDLYGPPPPDPLSQFGLNIPGTGRRPGRTLGDISIGGVNLRDVASLLGIGGDGVDISGLVNILAALVEQGGNIKGALDEIAPGLATELAPGFLALRDVLGGSFPNLADRLAAALDTQTGHQTDATRDATAATAGAVVASTPSIFQALIDVSGNILAKIADIYKDVLDTLVAKVLDIFRDDIEAHAPVTPENVDKVAAAALRSALTAGSVAQLAGMGLELLHPLKQMGVQQAIGVIATFAGFEEIAKPFFSATLRYGIGIPAEHRAAAHFRSVLPPVGDVRELAAAGLVGLDKYHDRLVLAGYPDPFPAAFVEHAYQPIPPRALAAFTDGSEADRPWLARKLRYSGLSPEDSDRIVTALELKATQPGRNRVLSAIMDDFKKGRVDRETLDAGLAGAGLSVTHRGYYTRAAELERRADRMEEIAGEVTNQYRNQVVGDATARQLLVGLGFTDDEVSTRLAVADLKKGLAQVQAEEKSIEAEIRALKTKGLASATRQLRAGFLDLAAFLAVGQGMGYTLPYLHNVADLALLQGPPSSKAGEPAIGEGALIEARQRIADLVAEEVRLKRTDRVSALVSLLRLGIARDLGEVLVGLAEALAGPNAITGAFGMPEGGRVKGAFGDIARIVLEGLGGIKPQSDVVAAMLTRLGLPARDRAALVRLIRDVRDLFRL